VSQESPLQLDQPSQEHVTPSSTRFTTYDLGVATVTLLLASETCAGSVPLPLALVMWLSLVSCGAAAAGAEVWGSIA
jgi:hypothetical protein